MLHLYKKLHVRLVKASNPLLVTIPFAACWLLFYADKTASPFYEKGNWLVIAIFLALYVTYGRIYEAFRLSLSRVSELLFSQGLALLLSDAIMYLVAWLLTKHLPNPLPLFAALVAQGACAMVWCITAHHWYFRKFPPRRTAILYDERSNMRQLISEYGLNKRFDIRQNLPVRDCIRKDFAPLAGVETVFLCGTHSHDRNVVLKYCIAHRISVYVLPGLGDVILSGAQKTHMFHLPMLRVTRYDPPPEYVLVKRTMDITLSLLALIVASPILLLTAIAIKATDGGPVFYKQCRLTKDGKRFNVLKFRSMRVDAEKDGVARLSTGDKDDRITPVGRFIRKVRIDELPQLLNILSGDMSLVGPRPERPEIAAQYEQELPEFGLRLQAKAGLTGYAQVYGKYNTRPYDKLQMDLMYMAHPSIGQDIKIILATVKILLTPESTEGVAEGQETALASS